jgi:tetratricopeptide (TPR) repeat protein
MRIVPLVFFVFLAAWAQAQESTPQVFARAADAFRTGDFDAAVRGYRAVLAAEPSNFPARSNLGAALVRLGLYTDAVKEYRAALEIAPSAAIAPLRMNFGLAYYKSGQIEDAAREFEQARRMMPGELNPSLLAADCYLRLGDFTKVEELLLPLMPAHPDDRALEYLLGTAYIRGGKVEKGQAMIDRLLRQGGSAEAHFLIGSVAFMAKDYPAAVKELGEAVASNPELPSLLSYYGRALLFTGDPDGAAKAFRDQLASDPNDYEANLRLADILRVGRSYSDARPRYEKALTLQPASLEANYGLAMLDLAVKQPAAARKRFEEIVARAPQYGVAHQGLADALDQLGRKEDAERERALADRLRVASGAADDGIPRDAEAPDFSLASPSGDAPTHLASYRGKQPVVLIFASYTCPKFRSQVDALNQLATRYQNRVAFLLVYIREAHGDSNWQSTINQREGVSQPDASSITEKREYASACLRKLKIQYAAVVDGMDGAVEKAYAGWPSRVYLIDRTGRVKFSSLLDRERFDADGLQAALETAISPRR